MKSISQKLRNIFNNQYVIYTVIGCVFCASWIISNRVHAHSGHTDTDLVLMEASTKYAKANPDPLESYIHNDADFNTDLLKKDLDPLATFTFANEDSNHTVQKAHIKENTEKTEETKTNPISAAISEFLKQNLIFDINSSTKDAEAEEVKNITTEPKDRVNATESKIDQEVQLDKVINVEKTNSVKSPKTMRNNPNQVRAPISFSHSKADSKSNSSSSSENEIPSDSTATNKEANPEFDYTPDVYVPAVPESTIETVRPQTITHKKKTKTEVRTQTLRAKKTKTETPALIPAAQPSSSTTPTITPVSFSVSGLTSMRMLRKNSTEPKKNEKEPSKKSKLVSIYDTLIDVNFIRKEEGKSFKAYVPLSNKSISGVTIGHGVDLGQINLKELGAMPISASLKNKLKPYIGMKQKRAESFLVKNPLTINPTELAELDLATKNRVLIPLVKRYNQSSGIPFTQLPSAAQTVIFSYAYQHGPYFYLQARQNQLWQHLIEQDWQKASRVLREFKKYASRRYREAQLLDDLA